MSSWILVPCLVGLRAEFNVLSPGRDKGADGSIGDSAHTSSSDHTPDEDSDVLRDHDGDAKNEVHALDIDSTGPWPASFDSLVKVVIARDKKRWLDPADVCRLEYVIWNRQIYSRERDFAPVAYRGVDPHTNHAHFSARYLTAAESDTRPWGLLDLVEDDDMTTKAEFIGWLKDPEVAKALCRAVFNTDDVIPAPGSPKPGENTHLTGSSYVRGTYLEAQQSRVLAGQARDSVAPVLIAVRALAATDQVDEQALAAQLAPAVAAQVLAGLPQGSDPVSQDEVTAAITAAFRGAFAGS
jgi:hypothetical protein